ncbi:MAG: hypothetical protein PHQ86_09365, partial [Dehalococcoidales bacterium]|nr:hypothetical protein [Dehalococcoidales bacterium]
MKQCTVYDLGIIDYQASDFLQEKLLYCRKSDVISNVLLLLQHPPVFTIGRAGNDENVIASKETLDKEGISVFRIKRGGDVTCHAPGQLVGYPILKLRESGLSVHQYVWNLEEIIIR